MDSGNGQIADDNKSIYTKALKTLIDEFIEAHPDIDRKRIYVGGLSNGGFMTMRLVADYPGFFAAGVPVCAPWVASLATDEEMASIAKTPLWFVQSADDPIVTAQDHALADYRKLKELGAKDVHITCFDHIQDETGRYHDRSATSVTSSGFLPTMTS
jgi:predicted peptidase